MNFKLKAFFIHGDSLYQWTKMSKTSVDKVEFLSNIDCMNFYRYDDSMFYFNRTNFKGMQEIVEVGVRFTFSELRVVY